MSMLKNIKIENHLSLAIKLILVVSILNSINHHLWHIMSTSIFLLVLMFIPQIIKRYEIELPREFEWVLLVFVVFTLFLGEISGVIAPIAFGVSIAFIGFMISAILYSSNQIKKNYFLIILFSFNFAVAFGVALELLKYYLKILLGQALNVEIYAYSMRNLTFVIIGAAISALIGYIYMKGYIQVLGKLTYKFIKVNPNLSAKESQGKEILDLIKKGENEETEFKSTLRTNLYTKEIDREMEYAVLKTIVAFLNSDGGTLLIGVSNKKEILGIEHDKFENEDKFSLHLTNIIKEKIGKKHLHLISTQFIDVEDKKIMKIECKKSSKEIFLKISPKEEEFYIRTGPSNAQLIGSDLVEYIEKRFRK